LLKIHFTAEDVAKVRVLDRPDPMWETVLSLHLLQSDVGTETFGRWRNRTRKRLTRFTGLLATLAPPKGYTADFLTPQVGLGDLDTSLELLLSTPRQRLREDVGELAGERPLPSWTSALAQGDREMLGHLEKAVRLHRTTALQPDWHTIDAAVRADSQARGRVMLSGGVDRLLSTLHRSVSWQAPVLEVAYPIDQDLYLDGRGLILLPSFFCWQTPITVKDPTMTPVLVYPVERHLGWDSPAQKRSLSNLLGRTRASVLTAIGDSPHLTTKELASLLGISPAGASQHATVLREAGLITTRREGGAALHTLATAGFALLDQPEPLPDAVPHQRECAQPCYS
jgi:DNA-binding transcriptional ArsR family regulator